MLAPSTKNQVPAFWLTANCQGNYPLAVGNCQSREMAGNCGMSRDFSIAFIR
jgi:hypothetical protein